MDGAVPVYFEAAAVITVLVCSVSSGIARTRANRRRNPCVAESSAEDGAPDYGWRDDEENFVGDVHLGDRLRVRPGDGVPVTA